MCECDDIKDDGVNEELLLNVPLPPSPATSSRQDGHTLPPGEYEFFYL